MNELEDTERLRLEKKLRRQLDLVGVRDQSYYFESIGVMLCVLPFAMIVLLMVLGPFLG